MKRIMEINTPALKIIQFRDLKFNLDLEILGGIIIFAFSSYYWPESGLGVFWGQKQ